MSVTSIKLYEGLVDGIHSGEKFQTIRYDWSEIPQDDCILNAVSSQERDVFAELRVDSTEVVSVGECVNRHFEEHENYSNKKDLLAEMSTYYPDMSKDDDLILIRFL